MWSLCVSIPLKVHQMFSQTKATVSSFWRLLSFPNWATIKEFTALCIVYLCNSCWFIGYKVIWSGLYNRSTVSCFFFLNDGSREIHCRGYFLGGLPGLPPAVSRGLWRCGLNDRPLMYKHRGHLDSTQERFHLPVCSLTTPDAGRVSHPHPSLINQGVIAAVQLFIAPPPAVSHIHFSAAAKFVRRCYFQQAFHLMQTSSDNPSGCFPPTIKPRPDLSPFQQGPLTY